VARSATKSANSVPTESVALGGDVSNAGEAAIILDQPYRVEVEVTGDSPILFHRWQSDSVEAKSKAAKGSAAKKTDDVESYVYRDSDGVICLPGEYLRGSLIDPRNGAAKYRQDPRSPRKSALDLFRAGVISMTDLAPITKADGSLANQWDYLDRRRVTVQRSGVTRERPAFNAGWTATVQLMVSTPAYINVTMLRQTLGDAGRLVGLADFRPTFGRFSVTRFVVLTDADTTEEAPIEVKAADQED
jgi:hypothetical protein